jgi:hypothetical protein
MTPRTRPALAAVPDQPDQVPRKVRFEQAHPGVKFSYPGGGMVQARFEHRGALVTITRPLLGDLLDELENLFGEAG